VFPARLRPNAGAERRRALRATEMSSTSGSPAGTRGETAVTFQPGRRAKWRAAAKPTRPDAPAMRTVRVAIWKRRLLPQLDVEPAARRDGRLLGIANQHRGRGRLEQRRALDLVPRRQRVH